MAGDAVPREGVPHEVELKYRVGDVEKVQAFLDGAWTETMPDVVLDEASIRLVEDRYFDTGRGALRRHGFGARLRRQGASVTLTVKSLAADDEPGASSDAPVQADALHRRIELEGPANARLDPAGWPSSPARELVDERLRERDEVGGAG